MEAQMYLPLWLKSIISSSIPPAKVVLSDLKIPLKNVAKRNQDDATKHDRKSLQHYFPILQKGCVNITLQCI